MGAEYASSTKIQDPFAAATEQFRTMTTHLASGEALTMTHDALESYLVEDSASAQCRAS